MIDEDAIRYRWETFGSKLDERGRRLFAAGEVRTARVGRAGGCFQDHRAWRVRRSIAAKTISTRRRCGRGGFAVPVVGARRLPRTIQGWSRNSSASSSPPRWAIPCGP
jgi:hypothetical protein